LEKVNEGEYKAEIKDKAEKGKANLKLIKLLGKEFKVSHDKIIIKNPTSRKKIVDIVQVK
ncbi:MAG: DUF167 family protein, partial [Nanoarchaeota archaeon]